MSNRELIVTGKGELGWRTGHAPVLPSPDGALVRPVAVATCDFDHLIVRGHTRVPLPVAIGHEFVAEVLETGGAVRRVRAGETVIVPFQVHCGSCATCRAGWTSSCERVPWLSCYGLGAGGGDRGGAVSDVVAVPWADAMLVRLPEGVEPAHAAALGCNVPDAYRCVGPQLAERPGADVLIGGGRFGSIGLVAVALARALGASRVDYLDDDPARRARAEELGATVVDRPRGAYPVTVDASMDPARLATLLEATAPAGTCTVSTMYAARATPLPLMAMFERCLTLRTGQPHVRPLLDPVLGLVRSGTLDLGALIDRIHDWEDAPSAFAKGAGKQVCIR